jgi:hypothetical protein
MYMLSPLSFSFCCPGAGMLNGDVGLARFIDIFCLNCNMFSDCYNFSEDLRMVCTTLCSTELYLAKKIIVSDLTVLMDARYRRGDDFLREHQRKINEVLSD